MAEFRSKPRRRFFGMAALGTALTAWGLAFALAPSPVRSQLAASDETTWAAAAPGRVEPKGSALRIVAPAPAQIKDVLVTLNDQVQKGDLLVRLDGEEQKARLDSAKAQAAVRMTDRDNVKASEAAQDRRKAEDNVYNAERSAFDARLDLDRTLSEAREGKASAADVQSARDAVAAAEEKARQDQLKLKKTLARDLPALKREDAALAAARADVAAAGASLEHMRIRAPIGGTVLELNAKAGEIAGPAAGIPLLVLGDTTRLQVRAEVEDRDAGNVHQGQNAVVKSDAFPNRAFEARVATVAKALGAPRLSSQSRGKPTDVDVLEVVLDLEDGAPLLPGMRVDVLFRNGEAKLKSSASSEK